MPIARFQMPDGRIARFEVPEGTTPEQAQAQFEQMLASGQLGGQELTPAQPEEPSFGEQALGTIEAGARIGSSILAEPVAGLAGIVGGILPGEEGQASEFVEGAREALTFEPRTQEGREQVAAVGEALAPVGEAFEGAETTLGDTAFELTGSPALAATAATLPTAVLEALGVGLTRRTAKAATGTKGAKVAPPTKVKEKAITKSLLESAPEIEQIKDASRAIYKEIDDLNVNVKPIATKALAKKVAKRAEEANADDVLTPKAARAVERITERVKDGKVSSVSDIDRLRGIAQTAAQSLDPADARVGAIIIDEIDDFLDKLTPKAFSGPDAKTASQVAERYKAARNLWGRARRAELVSEAFDKAEIQASGFENGLRTQFRQILNNKKRSRFFTKDELAAMKDVVEGTNAANITKLIGRLGFSEGAATNILGGLGGMAVLGPVAPAAGQLSRKLAQKMTRAGAENVQSLIRSGAKGREIARAYLQNTKKGQRSAQELSDLLLASGQEIDDMLDASNKLVKEAAEIARARKIIDAAEIAGAAAPVALQQEQE